MAEENSDFSSKPKESQLEKNNIYDLYEFVSRLSHCADDELATIFPVQRFSAGSMLY